MQIPDYSQVGGFEGFVSKFGADPNFGSILSAILPYLYVIAGLILLFYLIWGGFIMMTSGGDPKGIEAGKSKITQAIVGFLIIFTSYWLIQILQLVFGLEKIF